MKVIKNVPLYFPDGVAVGLPTVSVPPMLMLVLAVLVINGEAGFDPLI